jgi:hypothetical protein
MLFWIFKWLKNCKKFFTQILSKKDKILELRLLLIVMASAIMYNSVVSKSGSLA